MLRFMRSLLIVSTLVIGFSYGAGAQEASPDASPLPARDFALLRALGLPEIHMVATDDGVTGVPANLEAGRYLVTLENQSANEVDVVFLAVPTGTTDEDALNGILQDDLPAWFYEAIFAGGPTTQSGQTDAVIVELAAGAWWVDVDRIADAEVQPIDTATKLQVTGELTPAGSIEGAIPLSLTEFAFGLPDTIATGPHIWQLTNTGAQPHFMDLEGLPVGTTSEQLEELVGAFFTGTPAVTDIELSDSDLVDIDGTEIISPGQTTWIEVDLDPGTFAVACFIPDQGSGAPHIMMGMYQLFTVE